MAVVGILAEATGQNIDNITFSASSILRHWIQLTGKYYPLERRFELPETCLVLHPWDAKQVPGIAEGLGCV